MRGLNEFVGEHPPVATVFWSFRVMLAVGVAMLVVSWWAAWLLLVKKTSNRLLLKVLSWMTFSGWVGVLAGWIVAEVGRQPFIIHGQLRVSEVVAPYGAGTVLSTLLVYLALYGFLLVSYIVALRYMATKPARSLSNEPMPGLAAT